MSDTDRYLAPGWFNRRVFNPMVQGLTRVGVSPWGARQLDVRGRVSGEWRSVPVNPLDLESTTYLVAPRGTTQWVRNVRAAGTCRLRKGRHLDEYVALELPDAEKTMVIREYLRRWAFEVGQFFDDVDKNSPDARIAEVAPGFPVFRLEPA